MGETLFVFTNDDVGMHEPERFAELLDFLAEQEVPGTFFVVPAAGGKSLAEKPRWRALFDRALAAGHDLQLHGYTHASAFEFGVPPQFMLDLVPEGSPARQPSPHDVATLVDKLARGREILTAVLGYEPQGFRAPYLAVCDQQYQALRHLEFEWCSNAAVNPMGWRYMARKYDANEPWLPGMSTRPRRHPSGVLEAPLHSEYSWYLTKADVERHFQLARGDFDRSRARGEAFVPISHYFAMTGEWSAGLRVYRRLFDHARARGNVRFATLSQLVRDHHLELGRTA